MKTLLIPKLVPQKKQVVKLYTNIRVLKSAFFLRLNVEIRHNKEGLSFNPFSAGIDFDVGYKVDPQAVRVK